MEPKAEVKRLPPRRPSSPSQPETTGEMELPRVGHGRPITRPSFPSKPDQPPPRRRPAPVRAARWVYVMVRGLFAHNAFETAASIAFWFFLSLIPLLVFLGWLIGRFVQTKGVDSVLQPLLEIVPGQDAENLLKKQFERTGAMAAPLAPLSIAGFLWASSSGLHNLMDIFELAVRVPRRAYWKKRALALLWVLVGVGTATGVTWALVEFDTVVHRADVAATAPTSVEEGPSADAPPAPEKSLPASRPSGRHATPHSNNRFHQVAQLLHTPWERYVAALTLLGVGTTILAGFYRYAVVHPVGIRRRAWPGAFTAVLSWLAVSWGFGQYAASLGDYALYYGGLAAVAVLLVWLYLTSLVLVIGAEVNAQLEGVRAD